VSYFRFLPGRGGEGQVKLGFGSNLTQNPIIVLFLLAQGEYFKELDRPLRFGSRTRIEGKINVSISGPRGSFLLQEFPIGPDFGIASEVQVEVRHGRKEVSLRDAIYSCPSLSSSLSNS